MARPRERVCLEAGLKLNINKLPRYLFIPEDGVVWHHTMCWTDSYTGELVASALISTRLQTARAGWFRIQIGNLDQWIDLVAHPRHFGGRRWYFSSPCPPRCSVLWMPPGASRFTSRQNYGNEVAYASQFETAADRALRGQAKIIARFSTNDRFKWSDLPPKPKWMRWRTYNRLEQKYDAYEVVVDHHIETLAARCNK
jgi:hypothetical protein